VPSLDTTFVGDMQAPLSVERLVGREDNDAVRMRIRHEVARNVVFLEDLVAPVRQSRSLARPYPYAPAPFGLGAIALRSEPIAARDSQRAMRCWERS
jgi:hypothetical protein